MNRVVQQYFFRLEVMAWEVQGNWLQDQQGDCTFVPA